jgi:creatinine amidohydrolase
VWVETVRSLALWVGRVVFINGHGGNAVTLYTAVVQLRAEGHDVVWTCCGVPGGDAHAGRTETSVMLHLAPADVRMDEAVVGETRPPATVMPELIARGVRAVSPSGVLGDPTGASAEEGAEVVAAMVSAAVCRIARGDVDDRGHPVREVRV